MQSFTFSIERSLSPICTASSTGISSSRYTVMLLLPSRDFIMPPMFWENSMAAPVSSRQEISTATEARVIVRLVHRL